MTKDGNEDQDYKPELELCDMAEVTTEYEYFITKLVVAHYHNKFYKQLDRIVTQHIRMRVLLFNL